MLKPISLAGTIVLIIVLAILIIIFSPKEHICIDEKHLICDIECECKGSSCTINVYGQDNKIRFTIPARDISQSLRDSLKEENAKLVVVIPGK